MAALRKGLSETGYVEGRNLRIEYRWGEGHDERLPAFADDLVKRQVALIICGGSPSSSLAAKAATSTIPIVCTTGLDPIKLGLVPSLNRPGGNVTGIAFLVSQLTAKRVELLHQLLPKAKTIAALFNTDSRNTPPVRKEFEDAARSIGLQLHVLMASTESQIDSASPFLPNASRTCCWSATIRFSTAIVPGSSRWRRVVPCRRYTNGANSSPTAA